MPVNTLTTRVTDFVFDYIRENALKSGDTLPSEIRTSTDLKISRGIVREAFRSLQATGIIEVENGRPPRVGVLNSSFLTHLLLHALSTQQVSPAQVLDLRASIEVRAAELAARKRNDKDLVELRKSVAGMSKALTSPERFVQHDLRFHEVISGATGNPLVEVMCGAMHECMQESMRAGLRGRKDKSEIALVVESHQQIADAIEGGNAQRAGLAMKRHFDDAKRALEEPGTILSTS